VLEHAQPHQRKDLHHFLEKSSGVRFLRFGERRFLRGVAVVEVATLGVLGTLDESVFQPGDVCAVQPVIRRYERERRAPEIFVLVVRLDAGANTIPLPDVERWKVIILLITNKDINTCLTKLRPFLDLGPLLARKGDSKPCPVHTVNDADAFRVTVGNEDA